MINFLKVCLFEFKTTIFPTLFRICQFWICIKETEHEPGFDTIYLILMVNQRVYRVSNYHSLSITIRLH